MMAAPFFILFSQKKSWHKYAYRLNFLWASVYFPMNRMKTEVIYEEPLTKDSRYVLCPNHASALDIASICLINEPFVFIGKAEIKKIPIFGYMFRKLHIPVDRASLKSRYQIITDAKQALQEGKNVLLFPEGGIISGDETLSKFKDGPFRIAIETGTPIVPITIPFNWIILPDENVSMFNKNHAHIRIIVHKPIDTSKMTISDLDSLKELTHQRIKDELEKQMNEYRRPTT
jgi:1-acyl-sn-glycerol-3-phosphate acyltransferase